jgi:hypothetical protein
LYKQAIKCSGKGISSSHSTGLKNETQWITYHLFLLLGRYSCLVQGLKYSSLSFSSSVPTVGSINLIFHSGPGNGGIAGNIFKSTFSLLASKSSIINIFLIGLSRVITCVSALSSHHS